MAYYEVPQVVCDGCEAQKKEVNHWWLIFRHFPDDDEVGEGFRVEPWSDDAARRAEAHACGEECLHKIVSRWLASPEDRRTFDPPSLRAQAPNTHEVPTTERTA